MALYSFKIKFSYHQSKLYKTTILLMYLGFWIFGLSPFTNNYRIYQAFVVLWCCKIALTSYLAIIYEGFGDEQSLNELVKIILYVTLILGHLTVLIESCRMFKYRLVFFEQFSNIRKVAEKLKEIQDQDFFVIRLSRIVMVILMLLVCGHGIVMWKRFNPKPPAIFLYWSSLESSLALQFKTLDFLTGLLEFNYYVTIIRRALNELGERNLRRVFKKLHKPSKSKIIYVVQLNEQEKDEQLLAILKSTYNKVYATFQIYNEAHGWSLLTATAVYFVDFVSNSYWILLAVLSQGNNYHSLLQNASFALMALALLSISCWYAEECYCQSCYIGCLISKLAKPLGNKHYNDLVSVFSLQTLHQRFIITAKNFFNFNLRLLGSMVAAIVTYLVILIQFMFTENN